MRTSQISRRDFNNLQAYAYCVLSRSELRRMLDAIPEGESGDASCGIFIARLSADREDGKLQASMEHVMRLPTELEYQVVGVRGLKGPREMQPTALAR